MKIKETHYRDMSGVLLWKAPMDLERLWAVGDDLTEGGERWIVQRIAVVDTTQHVNVERAE